MYKPHPRYLGFQVDWPVFIKVPFKTAVPGGTKDWKRGEHFPWLELGIPERTVAILFRNQQIYHNREAEVQSKVGDRLSEMAGKQLETLVNRINEEVKSRTSGVTEFNAKKCKKSKVDAKQRGLIRRFLNNNNWVIEDFYKIRDDLLV